MDRGIIIYIKKAFYAFLKRLNASIIKKVMLYNPKTTVKPGDEMKLTCERFVDFKEFVYCSSNQQRRQLRNYTLFNNGMDTAR